MSTQFIDNVEILLKSGKGGVGAVSFRREKYIPMGGPDGGDGGRGGDIIIRSSPHERTLRRLRYKSEYIANAGLPGQGRKKHGADGKDLVIEVPFGTVIRTSSKDALIRFDNEVEEHRILKGGLGGKGNVHFKSSRRQAPYYAQPGLDGKELRIIAELELAADMCFIGAPNVGKSTLLKALTNADPKIANYPFTTLIPNLGILRNAYSETILVDIPGILEGASYGNAMGTSFLRHIRKASTICYVVDISTILNPDTEGKEVDSIKSNASEILFTNLKMLQKEVLNYDTSFAGKDFLVLCNKIDCIVDKDPAYISKVVYLLQKRIIEEIPVQKTKEEAKLSASSFHGVTAVSALHAMEISPLKDLLLKVRAANYQALPSLKQ